MRAAFVGVDVIRERIQRFGVPVVPLQGDLDVGAVLLAVHVDRLLVDGRLVLVQILDEGHDAALVEELVRLAVALVVDGDRDAAVEECQLAEAGGQRVEAVLRRLENLRVGPERDLCAALLRRAGHLEIGRRHAALVGLLVDLAVAPDFQLEELRQRVDDRHADAVEAARDLVAVVVELAAGVQDGEHDLGCGLAAFVEIDRDAAAVVDHGDGVVDVDRDVDLVAVPGQGLVDRVVDDLVDEMVQTGRAGRPDVHRRALADRLEALENLDLRGAVVRAIAVAVRAGSIFGVFGRRHGFRVVRLLVGIVQLVHSELRAQMRIGMMT